MEDQEAEALRQTAAEHLLPSFEDREDSLELSELTEAIDKPSMQEDDSTSLALVMVGDLNSVKGGERFYHLSRECEKPISQRSHGGRLQVRAESQQTAIAILHHELAPAPWHVAKSSSEFYALGCVLGIKSIGIFDRQYASSNSSPYLSGLASGGFAQRK